MARLPKRQPYRRPPYWTRERVVERLRAWYRERQTAPIGTEQWREATRGMTAGQGRVNAYPSFYAVLRHFPTFREAWLAAGVLLDRSHEEWTEAEDWYLREGAGIIPRVELARDLRRSPDAVHRRLYDLGLHCYEAHGWSTERVCQATGLRRDRLHHYMLWKRLPWVVGTKCWYFQPEDLVVVREIDWERCPELARAARRGLVGRLVGLLEGRRAALGAGLAALRGPMANGKRRVAHGIHPRQD